MIKTNIKLSTIDDVRSFVNIATKYDTEIDLISGRYTVDGKSIMGIFSLDLMKPIELVAHCDSCSALLEELKPFLI
ncbi:MAG: HPr family phosphocarrier protein [Eubacteriales bacterium]